MDSLCSLALVLGRMDHALNNPGCVLGSFSIIHRLRKKKRKKEEQENKKVGEFFKDVIEFPCLLVCLLCILIDSF